MVDASGGGCFHTPATAAVTPTLPYLYHLPPCTQLRVQVLPKAAAAALARLTGLSHLRLEVEQLGEDVGGSCLALSRLTSLTLRPRRGLLPARRLLELPQRLPLLVQLELSELWLAEDRLADLELLAPADFPHLRTYSFGFELCRRRLQVGCTVTGDQQRLWSQLWPLLAGLCGQTRLGCFCAAEIRRRFGP